jgi:glutamine synthetase
MGFISYKFIDSRGNLRDKVVAVGSETSRGQLPLQDTWFDGSSFGFCKTEKSDLLLTPDPKSYHRDPIRDMDSVFCFLRKPDGDYLKACFRNQAFTAQEQDDQTHGALFGVEPEFFLLGKTESHTLPQKLVPYGEDGRWKVEDVVQYEYYGCLPPVDKTHLIRTKILENLNVAGLEVEGCHHEVAPGQAEVSWKCDSLLRTADKMMLAKYIIKATAADFGAIATFDPKPFDGLNGNGCHVHQSLPMMSDSEENLFAYAQGLVDHYDELVQVCNTHENSHKRLTPGFEAPTKENNGYGWHDRTKTVRIPAKGDRVELRLPDPEMNPYMAFPLMLGFGYEGINNK